jgi:prephenate dehydratase
MKLALGAKKTAFLLQGDDRPGALADTLEKLAAAKINVTAMDAVTSGSGRFGAIFWVKPRDVNRAAKLLGAR